MDGLLAGLEEGSRTRVRKAARRRKFARGDILFHEGDPGDTLHLLEKGRVGVRTTNPLGSMVTMAVLGPGEVFGELALLDDDAHRTATVVALEAVETLTLHRVEIRDLRNEDRSIDRYLLEVLRRQIVRLTGQLLDALYTPVDARVVNRLTELTAIYDDGQRPVKVAITQEDIATIAGTTRPTANRILRDLEQRGLVALRRGCTEVADPAALAATARHPH